MSTQAPAIPTEPNPGYASATHGGMKVSSNYESAESIQESISRDENADGDSATVEDKSGRGAVAAPGDPTDAETEKSESAPERDRHGRFLPKEGKEEIEAKSDEKTEKPLGKPRDDPRARVEQVTREAAQLKREKADLERKLQDYERASSRPVQQTTPLPPVSTPKPEAEPRLGDFAGNEVEFIKAQARHIARQEFAAQEAQRNQRLVQQTQAQRFDQFQRTAVERFQKAIAEDPKVQEAYEAVGVHLTPTMYVHPSQVGPTNFIANEVLASDYGPQIVKHFYENPTEFQRIASLPNVREIQRAMAKLETHFEKVEGAAPTATVPKTVSKARPPVRPVAGTPSGEAEEGEISDSEYIRRNSARARLGKQR